MGNRLDFVALDVETANADMSTICQIGVACVSGGSISRTWKSYVDPEDEFDGMNISIHGIDENTVRGAPKFLELKDQLNELLCDRIVATHTAFDRVSINQASIFYGIAPPKCQWLDTARVARRAWSQFSRRGYGLENVCNEIGYEYSPHDALEDAKACAAVLLAANAKVGLSVDDWISRVSQPIDPTLKCPVIRQGNPEGELIGEVLVFTGALSILRSEAADLAAVIIITSGTTRA